MSQQVYTVWKESENGIAMIPRNVYIGKMLVPVECLRCGEVYDLCSVNDIVHRYQDCTLYRSPCCKALVDDREWKSSPDIRRINKD